MPPQRLPHAKVTLRKTLILAAILTAVPATSVLPAGGAEKPQSVPSNDPKMRPAGPDEDPGRRGGPAGDSRSDFRKPNNPVLGLNVKTDRTNNPPQLVRIKVTLAGTTRPQDVRMVRVLKGGPAGPTGEQRFGQDAAPDGELAFRDHQPLRPGDNWFWVCVDLPDTADINGRIGAAVQAVEFDDGSVHPIKPASSARPQRVGLGLSNARGQQLKSLPHPGPDHQSNHTLIAVYDIRRRSGGDLPAASCRHESQHRRRPKLGANAGHYGHGRRPEVALRWDWRPGGPGGHGQQPGLGRRAWSHGNRGWAGSGKGMKPDETGQLMMAYSDDDGRTLSKPINITGQVKDPEWYLVATRGRTRITLRMARWSLPLNSKPATRSGQPIPPSSTARTMARLGPSAPGLRATLPRRN